MKRPLNPLAILANSSKGIVNIEIEINTCKGTLPTIQTNLKVK